MDAASTTSLLIPGSEEGLRSVRAGVEAFAAARGLAPASTWPFQVALDEVISNIVRHGQAGAPIQVFLRLAGDALEVEVSDEAEPFNPLDAPLPDTAAPLEGRKVGGLGIALVRHLMDDVEYERTAGRNRLVLRRRVL
jgi:anti-sigma regulatory factor (Ser/Thr protein kinase)